jgi:hypothetical protein
MQAKGGGEGGTGGLRDKTGMDGMDPEPGTTVTADRLATTKSACVACAKLVRGTTR